MPVMKMRVLSTQSFVSKLAIIASRKSMSSLSGSGGSACV